MLTSEKELGMAVGLRSHKRYALYNGALPVSLLLFDLRQVQALPERAEQAPERLSEGAQMLLNRLRKNRKQWAAWARKRQIECYRVYDADMPEYAVSIDCYGEYLHVAEYKAPKTVNESDADRRMQKIRQVIPVAFDIAPENILYKRRERQRGSQQYQRQNYKGEFVPVREGRARLLVNLHDYLDTGLFLDHRPLRLKIATEAKDKRFLNLFCYTATASVHAALGGAHETTSVDMSRTYLDWARRNFKANDQGGARHPLIQADCLKWLTESDGQFDLILLDPPSFSNSKRMAGSFDIQRDHLQLLEATVARLATGGRLYFSSNLRSFKLDSAVGERWKVVDISSATVDDDFARRATIHRCWQIEKE